MKKSYKSRVLQFLFSLCVLFLSTPLFAVESYTLPSGQWRMISLPADPGGTHNTVKDIFADDITADGTIEVPYKDKWVVYAYDSVKGEYVPKELTDTLMQGVGYWIIQLSERSILLDMPEGSIPATDPFTVHLTPSAQGKDVQWNMVGHPFNAPIKFSEYKIKTSSGDCGQGCSPAQAKQKNIFHDVVWRFKDGAYELVSGDMPLTEWDGFWCATLANSAGLSPQIILGAGSTPQSQPPIAGNWKLQFEEKFDGNSLDPDKWRVGQHHLGIAGNAANSADQISVAGGNLKLTAEKKPSRFVGKWGKLRDFDYVSGEVSTFQQFKQPYGYFEARIKYDAKQGVWPAFWTMPDRGDYGFQDWAHESFMRFNLDNISQPVNSAVLKVKVTGFEADPYSPNNDVVNITVHKVLENNWSEQSINWNTKPKYDPIWLRQFIFKKSAVSLDEVSGESASQEAIEYNQSQTEANKNTLYPLDPAMQTEAVSSAESVDGLEEIAVGQELVIDVTSYINSRISGKQKTAEFALVDTFMRVHKISFGSKEAANPADRPRLEINGSLLESSADAHVQGGTYATQNFGGATQLLVQDPFRSTSSTKGGGMEIDIMESLGVWGENKTQHAVHWNGYKKGEHKHSPSAHINLSPTADGYHTYGMNWQPDRIDFYIDGNKSGWAFPPAGVANSPGNIASYVLLSHQLGGWDNNLILDGGLPATMYIDHVRVWAGSSSQ
jgi:beta-glucanase (GH16 family)